MQSLGTKALERFTKEICPNRGADEEKLVTFLRKLAHAQHWKVCEDATGNMAIHIPSTRKNNTKKPVILQGHLDMVIQKDASYDIEKRGIETEVVDGWVQSVNHQTTLGADNGIAIAIALELAQLEERPPLILLLTRDEEGDMTGAKNLDLEALGIEKSGAIHMINMDNNISNQLLLGSGGGVVMEMNGRYSTQDPKYPQYTISFAGLQGGHSGEDIDKGRMHIIQESFTFLRFLKAKKVDFELVNFYSGEYDNAISESSQLTIGVKDETVFSKMLHEYYIYLIREYPSEKTVRYSIEPCTQQEPVLIGSQADSLIEVLSKDTVGLISRDERFGIPEISNNLGICSIGKKKIRLKYYGRAGDTLLLGRLFAFVSNDFEELGLELKENTIISPWAGKDSLLAQVFTRAYEDVIPGEKPQPVKTHSSLECGTILERFGDRVIDIISIGPDIKDEHCRTEALSVASVHFQMQILVKLMSILVHEEY